MSESRRHVSRRQFLGGAAALAAGGLASGHGSLRAQEARPTPALPLADLAPDGPLDEAYWWKVRSQFNLVDGLAYMNNGTLGPLPRVVQDENARIFREIAEDPTNGGRRDELDERRKTLARFVGASPDEVSYTRSTTEGMNIFAHGLDWREGDEVIMCTHEHSGGIEPYLVEEQRRGIKIVWVDIPSPPESVDQVLSIYEDAITPRTRAIMISHITYVTGLLLPAKELTELAHRRGLMISVDGAHPVGMLDLDFHDMGCDHYAGAGQKWLLCGTGTGVNYVKQDVQDEIWPLIGLGGSRNAEGEITPAEGARKYEDAGQRDVPSAYGMVTAVEFQDTIGKRNIEARVRQLSMSLKEGLAEIPGVHMWTSMKPELSAGLTLFSVRDVPMANVQSVIQERNRVYIRTMGTGSLNAVRASTHLYNMPEEVDRLLDGVRHVASNWSNYMAAPA